MQEKRNLVESSGQKSRCSAQLHILVASTLVFCNPALGHPNFLNFAPPEYLVTHQSLHWSASPHLCLAPSPFRAKPASCCSCSTTHRQLTTWAQGTRACHGAAPATLSSWAVFLLEPNSLLTASVLQPSSSSCFTRAEGPPVLVVRLMPFTFWSTAPRARLCSASCDLLPSPESVRRSAPHLSV